MIEFEQFIPAIFIIAVIGMWLTSILFILKHSKQKENKLNTNYKKLYSQKKSSEVRL